GAGLEWVAIMPSLCAVRACESRLWVARTKFAPAGSVKRAHRAAARPDLLYLIGNLERQLARFLDQLCDSLFRRQHLDQLALVVGVPHRLGQPGRVAVGE